MSASASPFQTVATKPIEGQRPGTSGLRKKVKVFQTEHYLENFVQSMFDVLPDKELKGATLVLAGDGRFFQDHAVRVIVRMAAANGVGKLLVSSQGALMPTPCVSALIRARKAYGGIILTASHNPGGPDEDFGVKYNVSNGGPAPSSVTEAVFERTKVISEYKIARAQPTAAELDTSRPGKTTFAGLEIEVVDAAQFYADFLATVFDFDALRALLARKDFSIVYDAMHGVAGPFAVEIFCKRLGAPREAVINSVPKPDFGGGHPDPNLTYAEDLVKRMGVTPPENPGAHGHGHGSSSGSSEKKKKKEEEEEEQKKGSDGGRGGTPQLGAAADGDADRNMILGPGFFVNPSDSVAIIAAQCVACIPYFKKGGLKGVARSMPTSQALDLVAKKKGCECYVVPTGWKFFGNLMDAGRLSLCGEESFGTGSDHVREKDGIWAVLAWLSILAHRNADASAKLVGVQDVVEAHWREYGRNFYTRYDFEGVASKGANEMMARLRDLVTKPDEAAKVVLAAQAKGDGKAAFELASADDFRYEDPVDKSVSTKQGIRFRLKDGSRFVFRLSGTGSSGATVRLYGERYDADPKTMMRPAQEALKPLIELALAVSKLEEFTGRKFPSVIT